MHSLSEETLGPDEILDELHDKKLVRTIAESRRAIHKGAKGITLESALKKRRKRNERTYR